MMVKQVIARYNCYHLIGVGFSMGANVLLKYLGEEPGRQRNFTCAVSVCQGYDISRLVHGHLTEVIKSYICITTYIVHVV